MDTNVWIMGPFYPGREDRNSDKSPQSGPVQSRKDHCTGSYSDDLHLFWSGKADSIEGMKTICINCPVINRPAQPNHTVRWTLGNPLRLGWPLALLQRRPKRPQSDWEERLDSLAMTLLYVVSLGTVLWCAISAL